MNRNIAITAMGIAALLLMAPEAFAATQAGTKVHNSASVSYKIGTVQQTAPPAGTADFLVDRKVDLVVTELGGTTTTATPGATDGASVVTTFTVTNNTNDKIDVKLSANGQLSGTVFDAGTAGDGADTITSTEDNAMTFTLYRDDVAGGGNNDGVPDAGEALPIDGSPYIDGMAGFGATAKILVVANAIPDSGSDPGEVQDGDILAVLLTGTAATAYTDPDGDTGVPATSLTWDINGVPDWSALADAGNLGNDLADSATDGSTLVDNVLAESEDSDFDPAGTEHDGTDAAIDAYEIGGATIVVTKRSAVYWDPINAFTTPKAIPGSVVLYCITVSNTGTAQASDIAVSDIVPTNTTFEEGATDTDASTLGTQPLTDGVVTLADTNSIRFSSANTCTATDWDAAGSAPSGAEDSDSAAPDSADANTNGVPDDDDADLADGNYGDLDGTTVKTRVTSLMPGNVTPQYTTTMFLVKVN